MKAIQQTSLEAYESLKPLRRRRHRQICEALAKHGDMCNKELSEAIPLPINSVTPQGEGAPGYGPCEGQGLQGVQWPEGICMGAVT